jgi:hypothetical protein
MGAKPRGHELSRAKADETIEGIESGPASITDDSQTPGSGRPVNPSSLIPQAPARIIRGEPIRRGHELGLKMMENEEAVRKTLRLYNLFLADFGVYLRIVEKGLTVISLDYAKCHCMIGVGGRGTEDVYLQGLPPTIAQVRSGHKGYLDKCRSLNRNSPEERFSLECVHHALSNGCKLARSGLYFIHQEWRLPTGNNGDKLDILAVDVHSHELVVIELKRSEAEIQSRSKHERGAEGEAAYYAGVLHSYRSEYYPFFQRLARAMAKIYDGPKEMNEIELKPDHMPRIEVWFPPNI